MKLVTFLSLCAAGVVAQTEHVLTGYEYYGCVNIDCSNFQTAPVQPAGVLTPETCQTACTGHTFAAVFWDVCRCGDLVPAFVRVPEATCDNPCQDSWANGACGHYDPSSSIDYGNLYMTAGTQLVAGNSSPAALSTSPSTSTDTPCSEVQPVPSEQTLYPLPSVLAPGPSTVTVTFATGPVPTSPGNGPNGPVIIGLPDTATLSGPSGTPLVPVVSTVVTLFPQPSELNNVPTSGVVPPGAYDGASIVTSAPSPEIPWAPIFTTIYSPVPSIAAVGVGASEPAPPAETSFTTGTPFLSATIFLTEKASPTEPIERSNPTGSVNPKNLNKDDGASDPTDPTSMNHGDPPNPPSILAASRSSTFASLDTKKVLAALIAAVVIAV